MKRSLVVALFVTAPALGVFASCADDTTLSPVGPDATVDGALADAGTLADDASTDGAIDDVVDAGIDVAVPLVDTCGDAGVVPGAWVADPHLCLTVFADEGVLGVVRQIAFAPNGDIFVVYGQIVVGYDLDKNGSIGPGETSQFVLMDGLNHGIAFSPDGAFVYASTASTVYRWAYALGDRVASGPEQIVVANMPTGGHVTRTLAFDAEGRLYVSVGSSIDVETDPALIATRDQVRQFTIPVAIPDGGIDYGAGEVFASGLRNEVGIAFDSKGRFWGVENGSDGTFQGVSTVDNPAEELNRLDAPGTRFYGYPFCWSEWSFPGGLGPGTQWAYVGNPNPQTDAWCRDLANVQPPAAVMQGHWAPLGVGEYTGGSLPWKGDLFIGSHGSSGRVVPVGRLVARAHLVGDKVVSITPVVGHLGADGGLEEGTWDARPVDVRTGPDGALYFSDDSGYRVFRLGYKP